jgi:hypothetical protein
MKLIVGCLLAVVVAGMTLDVSVQAQEAEAMGADQAPGFRYESTGRDPFMSLLRLKEQQTQAARGVVLSEEEELPPLRTRSLVTDSEFVLMGLVWTEREAGALISWTGADNDRIMQQVREGAVLSGTGYRVVGIDGGRGEVLLSGPDEVILLHVRRAGG